MQNLLPNTVIFDKFLLKEELSVDPATGQRTWSVLDQQTGQPFIVRFNMDGTNEWFNDNRPEPTKTVEKKHQETISDSQLEKTSTTQPVAPISARKAFVFLLILVVLITSYLYHSSVIAFVKESLASSEPATLAISENQDAPVVEKLPSSAAEVSQDAPSDTPLPTTAIEPEPAVSHFTVQEAVQALNSIHPSTSYQGTFENARKAFAHLRDSESGRYVADSVYVLCAGKGAKAYLAFQQNKDQNLKRYSYEWYQTAYVLKPSPDLLDRLNRLK